MRRGLEKTRRGFMSRINELLGKGRIDEDLVDELESILVTSDIGIRTTERLLCELREGLKRHEIANPEVVRMKLKERIHEIVSLPCAPIDWSKSPTVIMVIWSQRSRKDDNHRQAGGAPGKRGQKGRPRGGRHLSCGRR